MQDAELSAAKIKSKLGCLQFAVALAVFIALAMIVLEPNPSYITADDFFTMPERLWFIRRNEEWLFHLLNFSQTRFTNVGDLSLFRPVLFLMWWLEDIAGRHHRDLYHAIAMATGIGWTASAYLLLRRFVGFFAATFLAAILLLPPGNDAYNYFMSWPQLNVYGVALLLFNVGLLLLPLPGSERHILNLAAAGLCFVIGGLSHEFVVPSLIVMVVLYAGLIVRDRRTGEISVASVQCCTVAACALITLGIAEIVHFTVLSDLSEPIHPSRLQPILISLYKLCALIAMPLLPENIGDYARIIIPVAAAILLAIFIIFDYVKVQTEKILPLLHNPALVGPLAAFTAIVVGVFVGRIITDGYTATWYYRFLSGYEIIILAAGSTIVVVCRAGPVRTVLAVLALFLICGFGWQARTVRQGNQTMSQSNQTARVVSAVQRSIAQHPQWCFDGVWPKDLPPNSEFLPRPRYLTLDNPAAVAAIYTILQYYNCTERSGEPIYFSVSPNGRGLDVKPLRATPLAFRPQPSASITRFDGPAIAFAEPLYKVLGTNIQAFRKTHELHPDSVIDWDHHTRGNHPWRGQIVANIEGACPCEVQIKVASDDSFPRIYNLGFVFDYGQPNATALLLFENHIVFGHLDGEQLQISSLGFVPDMRADLDLTIRSDANGCMIFANRQLVAADSACKLGAGPFGTFSWPNGTPPERMTDLRISTGLQQSSLFVLAQ